jgi:hypothetical protein
MCTCVNIDKSNKIPQSPQMQIKEINLQLQSTDL